MSKDYGSSFTLSSAPLELEFSSVTSDSRGRNLVAVTQEGGIYYSKNGGTTWTLSTSAPKDAMWSSVVSDYTGQYVTASSTCIGTNCSAPIYRSCDYGQTWSASFSVSGSFKALASNRVGDKIYATHTDSVVFIGTFEVPFEEPLKEFLNDEAYNADDDDWFNQ